MANARIESWLSGKNRDYNAGVELFAQYGNDEVLLMLFKSGRNSYTIQLLIDSLRELTKEHDPEPEIEEKEWSLSDDEYKALPDIAKAQQREWKANYREMKYLQARLDDPGKDDGYRLDLALRILQLDELVREAWRKIAFWRKYGAWPDAPKVAYDTEAMTVADMIRRRNSIRTYLSKFGKDESKKEKVKVWEAELVLLETKISEEESYAAE